MLCRCFALELNLIPLPDSIMHKMCKHTLYVKTILRSIDHPLYLHSAELKGKVLEHQTYADARACTRQHVWCNNWFSQTISCRRLGAQAIREGKLQPVILDEKKALWMSKNMSKTDMLHLKCSEFEIESNNRWRVCKASCQRTRSQKNSKLDMKKGLN